MCACPLYKSKEHTGQVSICFSHDWVHTYTQGLVWNRCGFKGSRYFWLQMRPSLGSDWAAERQGLILSQKHWCQQGRENILVSAKVHVRGGIYLLRLTRMAINNCCYDYLNDQEPSLVRDTVLFTSGLKLERLISYVWTWYVYLNIIIYMRK